MAIMGFGGGAIIGSPLATLLMNYFKTPTNPGVWETFLVMSGIYTVFMLIGAFAYRLPPPGWKPEGWTPSTRTNAMITTAQVHLDNAHKTPQFWLLWLVLCLNVSAGIGIIGAASPMLQETFGGALIGRPELGFADIKKDAALAAHAAGVAAGFVGLISLFNIFGRIGWASSSDVLGRKLTYFIFFVLGGDSMCSQLKQLIGNRWRFSSPASASSRRCTEAALRRFQPTSPTCSARSSSAPFMDAF